MAGVEVDALSEPLTSGQTLKIGEGEIVEVVPLGEDTGTTPIFVSQPASTRWGAVALAIGAAALGVWALRRWA